MYLSCELIWYLVVMQRQKTSRDYTSSFQPMAKRSRLVCSDKSNVCSFYISSPERVRSDSEFPEPSSSFRNSSGLYGSITRTGSAESAHGLVSPRGGGLRSRGTDTLLGTRRRGIFINPFDSSKTHTEITAYHRRWMHTFPRNREGFAFQIHHAILEELAETSSLGSQTPSSMRSRQSSVSSLHMTTGADEGAISRRRKHGSTSLDDHDTSKNNELTPGGLSHSSGSRQEESGKDSPKEGVQDVGTVRGTHSHAGGTFQSLDSNTLKFVKPSGSSHQIENTTRGAVRLKHPLTSAAKRTLDTRKLAEDFASVRRTGVDWKSLTEPACLPVTTDYFPPKSKLINDYYEHPSKLVVSSYNYGEEEFPEGKT